MNAETSSYPEPAPTAAQASGWTGSDLIIGTSLVVLLVALFMPWFSGTVRVGGTGALLPGSADGPRAHGYLWFVFALVIVALIVLVARDAISRVPGSLPSPEQILMVATGLALLLTILGVAIRPAASYDIVSPAGGIAQFLPRFTISIGWSYGGFIAVLAAAVAFIASFGVAGPVSSVRGATRVLRRRRGATG